VDSPLRVAPGQGQGSFGGFVLSGGDVCLDGEAEWVAQAEPAIIEDQLVEFESENALPRLESGPGLDSPEYSLLDEIKTSPKPAARKAIINPQLPDTVGGRGHVPLRPAVGNASASFRRQSSTSGASPRTDRSSKGAAPANQPASHWRSLKTTTPTSSSTKPSTPPWRKKPEKPDFFYMEGEVHVSDDDGEKAPTEMEGGSQTGGEGSSDVLGEGNEMDKQRCDTSGSASVSASVSESTLSHPGGSVSFNIKKEN
jgi:hypothetical protein